MKQLWSGIGVLLLGIALCGLTIFCVMEDMTFLGTFALMGGIGAVFGGYNLIKSAVADLKAQMEKDKEEGTNTANKEITRHVLVVVGVVLAVVVCVVVGLGISGASGPNAIARYILSEPFSAETMEDLEDLELRMSREKPLVRLFFAYSDEIKAYKAEYQTYIQDRAKEISEGIDALQPCTEITSSSHYSQLSSTISKLRLDANDPFEAAVRQEVTNYEELEQYARQIEELRDTYKHQCDDCSGRGGHSCSRCGGRGSKTCSSCDGRGKKLVTWYSQGDWGEKSYSSYECTSCDGRGKSNCSSCRDGWVDCSCSDGYVYIYEDDK